MMRTARVGFSGALLVALVASAGCSGATTAQHDDLAQPDDLSQPPRPPDLTPVLDLTAALDLTATPDLAVMASLDMPAELDQSLMADLEPPPDLAPVLVPPAAVWWATGGGSGTGAALQGNFSVGVQWVSGRSVAASGATLSFGYFTSSNQ